MGSWERTIELYGVNMCAGKDAHEGMARLYGVNFRNSLCEEGGERTSWNPTVNSLYGNGSLVKHCNWSNLDADSLGRIYFTTSNTISISHFRSLDKQNTH